MAESCLAQASNEQHCRVLLEVSESIASQRSLPDLFHELAENLHRIVQFDFVNLVLPDLDRQVMRLHILESLQPVSVTPGCETPMAESPGGWVWEHQAPLVINDVDQETRFPRVMAVMRECGVKSCCMLPLTTAQRRVGALGFGSTQTHAYDQQDLELLEQVARQVAVAVDNTLNYEQARAYQQQLARERDRLSLLLEVNNALVSHLNLRELFAAITSSLRRVMQCDYTSLALYDKERNELRLYALDFPDGKGVFREGMLVPPESPPGRAFASREPMLIDPEKAAQSSPELFEVARAEGLRSGCIVPLVFRDRALGTLNIGSLRPDAFTPDDVELLKRVANQVAIAVENAMAYRKIEALKEKLAEEKLYLEDEIRTEHHFEDIVGESPALKRVLKQVETVAPTDSTVLLLGETGTGKEVLARAIHNLSTRRERTFVKVNCAAIPSGLLESELFGHEKGAFTGALAQKIGRFELAHQGTLFLDEVGDIPLELQPKLLRVLQEHEFERLGSTRTIRVDVRVVAATNRDLAQMIADHQFRSDLYYRLNVFPIYVPPLRERTEDIPALVRYFAQQHAHRMNKQIETIPAETMDALMRWHWPGNVRELENIIERAVILSPGPVLRVPLGELTLPSENPPPFEPPVTTLEEAEREHILRALRHSNWVIGGPKGAARYLGMKRTTLQSRMRKLGISRAHQVTAEHSRPEA
jgi:formate hydrogenlyase transcriptional activator